MDGAIFTDRIELEKDESWDRVHTPDELAAKLSVHARARGHMDRRA